MQAARYLGAEEEKAEEVKQMFIVEIHTDGMDFPRDMERIATAIKDVVPVIVRPYVLVTKSAKVKWVRPVKKPRKK